MILPPRLRPGDRIAVVAPAGPVPREALAAGLARLGDRYRLDYTDALYTREGYLAGSDERRAAELNAALQHPELRAVFCARGGYGLTRILPALAPASPKLVIGFSDVTALHAACLARGYAGVHGPTLTHLGVLSPAHTDELLALLESPSPPAPWTGLAALAPGRATGRAVGGNLELIAALVGTPWAFPLEGNVLFVEEVGERPYRIDRSLTQLEHAGARRLAALVVGELLRCNEPDGSGPTAAEVLAERARRWGVPTLAGAPFGHGELNRPFPIGARVTVDADRGTVSFLEGAVA